MPPITSSTLTVLGVLARGRLSYSNVCLGATKDLELATPPEDLVELPRLFSNLMLSLKYQEI